MLKRINWTLIAKSFAWVICLAGVVVLLSFINIQKQDVKCTNVKIRIPGADNFIEREEIDAILKQEEGLLVGRSLDQINIHKIEKTLKANPYIAFAKVYIDMDGVLSIEVKQRQPVLRILNAGGQDYYIDSDGLKMPMSANFTANVLVATGNILEGFGGRVDTLLTPMAKDLYQTALFMKKDTLWDAQIEQIYVNEKNDIELIPRVGSQRIILGNADSLQTKMDNLLAFYKKAMPMVGWNAYKTINLKYTNQIVCEKADSSGFKNKLPTPQLDSSMVIKKSVDSLVKSSIADEIKKATTVPAVEVKKEVLKPTVKPKEATAISKEQVTPKAAAINPAKTKEPAVVSKAQTTPKATVVNSAKPKEVLVKEKTKPVVKTVKDKTDTKKPGR